MCVGILWPVVIWICVVYSYKGWLVIVPVAYSVFSGVLLYPAAEVTTTCRIPIHSTHSTITTSDEFLNSRFKDLPEYGSLKSCIKLVHIFISRCWICLKIWWLSCAISYNLFVYTLYLPVELMSIPLPCFATDLWAFFLEQFQKLSMD